jgi:hypothetical protein
MDLEELPATENGNNWTNVVLRCPRAKWAEILRGFFKQIKSSKECLIPHYKVWIFEPSKDLLVIEIRVLRRDRDVKFVKSKIAELLKGYDFQVDPQKHTWLAKKGSSPKWTRERCLVLSMISRFVLEIIDSNTSEQDKEEWAHMFSNMMTMFEVEKTYKSPETLRQERYKVLRYE